MSQGKQLDRRFGCTTKSGCCLVHCGVVAHLSARGSFAFALRSLQHNAAAMDHAAQRMNRAHGVLAACELSCGCSAVRVGLLVAQHCESYNMHVPVVGMGWVSPAGKHTMRFSSTLACIMLVLWQCYQMSW